MSEERLSIKLESEETFRVAETDYLKKSGVEKIGDHKTLTVKETDEGVEICDRTVSIWYFTPGKLDTKSPEVQKGGGTCITLSKDFLPEVKDVLDEYLTKGKRPGNPAGGDVKDKMPRINPHASALQQDAQLRQQIKWLKGKGFKTAREAQEAGH